MAYASAGLSRSGVRGARRRRTPDAVEDGVGEGGGDRVDRALAGARGRQLGVVQQHDVDRLGRLGDVEDRVGEPIGAGDLGTVEGDLLRERAAAALDDVAFDAAAQPVGIDDQPAIMRDGEFARLHLAGAAVDLDLGDDRGGRLRLRLALGDEIVANLSGSRRKPSLTSQPAGSGSLTLQPWMLP